MNGGKKKPKSRSTTMTPEEVGRERGRVQGDPRFTAAEKEASERVAKREMDKALAQKRAERARRRRY